MSAYMTFLKKELLEHFRMYKVLILLAVCVLLGMLSPLTAHLTPVILDNFMVEGVSITLPNPTMLDSWVQFFKNITQLGFVVLVLLFGGMIVHEVSEGTLIPILTKGISRTTVILSKYTAAVALWTVGYTICFLVCYVYTVFLFEAASWIPLLQSVLLIWIFGVFLLAVSMLAGTIVKSVYSSLLLTGGVIVLLFLVNIVPDTRKYSPLSLTVQNMAVLKKEVLFSDIIPSMIVTFMLILICIVLSCIIFRKKQL